MEIGKQVRSGVYQLKNHGIVTFCASRKPLLFKHYHLMRQTMRKMNDPIDSSLRGQVMRLECPLNRLWTLGHTTAVSHTS